MSPSVAVTFDEDESEHRIRGIRVDGNRPDSGAAHRLECRLLGQSLQEVEVEALLLSPEMGNDSHARAVLTTLRELQEVLDLTPRRSDQGESS